MKKLIPFNPEPDGTCRTIKAQYGKSSLANFLRGGVRSDSHRRVRRLWGQYGTASRTERYMTQQESPLASQLGLMVESYHL